MFETILTHQLQSAVLSKIRDALLPKLISGKVAMAGTEGANDGR